MIELTNERTQNSKTFDLSGGQRRLEIGGDNVHYRDNAGDWQDVDLSMPEIPFSVGFDEYYSKNGVRVEVSTAQGAFRIYPKRNDDASYVEIATINPTAITTQVINNKYLKVYKDTPNVEYAFIISARGFKILYKIKNATGMGNFVNKLYFRLRGNLTRSGRQIKYNNNTIFTLPDATWYDSGVMSDENRKDGNIVESIDGSTEIVTLTRPTLIGVTYPVYIDPSLEIQDAGVEDSYMRAGTFSGDNFGSVDNLPVKEQAGDNGRRSIISFDFSSLPAGVTIDSSTLELFAFVATAEGDTVDAKRVTRTDWVEAQVTWNDYKTSSAWTSGGGDFTETNKASSVCPAVDNWQSWDVKDQIQYARDNTSDIAHMIIMLTTESFAAYKSTEHATSSDHPKLTINYTVADVRRHIIQAYMGSN